LVCGVQLEGKHWEADMDIARAVWKWIANDKRRHSLLTRNTTYTNQYYPNHATNEVAFHTKNMMLAGSSNGAHIAMLLSLELAHAEEEEVKQKKLEEEIQKEKEKSKKIDFHYKDKKLSGKALPVPSSLLMLYPKVNWGEIDPSLVQNMLNEKKETHSDEIPLDGFVEEEGDTIASDKSTSSSTTNGGSHRSSSSYWNQLFGYKPSLKDSSFLLNDYLKQLDRVKQINDLNHHLNDLKNGKHEEDDDPIGDKCSDLSLAHLPPSLIIHGYKDSFSSINDVKSLVDKYHDDVEQFKV
jgi:hypothetical protein